MYAATKPRWGSQGGVDPYLSPKRLMVFFTKLTKEFGNPHVFPVLPALLFYILYGSVIYYIRAIFDQY